MRRSTIEVHPYFSEAPHMRSSILSAMDNPMAQAYNHVFFETRLALRRFWVKKRRHPETNISEMWYLYSRTRHTHLEMSGFFAVCRRRRVIIPPLLVSTISPAKNAHSGLLIPGTNRFFVAAARIAGKRATNVTNIYHHHHRYKFRT